MRRQHLSRILNACVTLFLLGVSSTGALADRYNSNGVPADLYGELQGIRAQLDSLQQAVTGLTDYLEAETAGTGDAYSEICFNARLGVLANGSIAVHGTNASAVSNGVDVYGLLDIDAYVQGEGQAQLAKMLESGIDMTVKMCLNAGVTNVVGVARTSESVMPPAGLDDLLNATNVALMDIYDDFPNLVASLPAGPESIDPGVDVLTSAASGLDEFSTSTLLNGNNWTDAVNGLPGAAVLGDRYQAMRTTFDVLRDGDTCRYYDGLYPAIDPALASGLQWSLSSCAFVDNLGVPVLISQSTILYDNNTSVINFISGAVDNSNGLLGSIRSTVNANRSILGNIEVTVEDILDALP